MEIDEPAVRVDVKCLTREAYDGIPARTDAQLLKIMIPGVESFPGLHSYYSNILYKTLRLFPSTKLEIGKTPLLMLEPPKNLLPEPKGIEKNKNGKDSKTPEPSFKRKCIYGERPTKALKISLDYDIIIY